MTAYRTRYLFLCLTFPIPTPFYHGMYACAFALFFSLLDCLCQHICVPITSQHSAWAAFFWHSSPPSPFPTHGFLPYYILPLRSACPPNFVCVLQLFRHVCYTHFIYILCHLCHLCTLAGRDFYSVLPHAFPPPAVTLTFSLFGGILYHGVVRLLHAVPCLYTAIMHACTHFVVHFVQDRRRDSSPPDLWHYTVVDGIVHSLYPPLSNNKEF